jgi:hypothetical protein
MNYDPFTTTTTKYETPYSEGCQYYLAEKCSQEWTDACDDYYTNNSTIPSSAFILQSSCPSNLGNAFLINTATLRFFDNVGEEYQEPLNPLDPESVFITKYKLSVDGFQNLVLSPRLTSKNIDTDPVMQRLLLSADSNRAFLKILFAHLVFASRNDVNLKTTMTYQYLNSILRV